MKVSARPRTPIVMVLLLSGLAAGCQSPLPSPSPTPSGRPNSPTPSAMPTSTTIAPSSTAPPRISTPTASAVAQWIVRAEERGIIVANPEGPGTAWLVQVDPQHYGPPRFAVSPDGKTLAVTIAAWSDTVTPPAFSLRIFTFPELEPTLETNLLSPEQLGYISSHFPPLDPDAYNYRESSAYQRAQIAAAIAARNSLAWSPDGTLLAFVAAIEGPTSDVYILDMISGNIRRVSTGNSQAGHLHWSPDGQYIIHQAVSDYNVGRSGTDIIDSLWAASPSGGSPRLLVDAPAFFLGWLSPHIMLGSLWLMQCDSYDLFAVDVAAATYTTLWRGIVSIDWENDQDFRFTIPPPQYDVEQDDQVFFEMCPPPANPSALIDLSAATALPQDAFTPAQSYTLLLVSEAGQLTFTQLTPTPTHEPTTTPTPRPPLPP